jgi:predicted peptidase
MRRLLSALMLLSIASPLLLAQEPAPGKQVEQELKSDAKSVPYLLYLPQDYQSKEKWPLMLFLHGRGESKPPLSTVAKWGPPRQFARGEHLPYIVISPQCPTNESWAQPGQQALLVKLLDQISEKYKVDKDRVYLTGLSMGGYGSWRLAADHPERFAAVVPVCGGGNPSDASKLKDLPIWAWHGTEDTAVPLQRSVDMVEAIKKAGGSNIRLTTLEHIGHFSWEAAYTAPDLYQWLDKQSRKN